MSMDIAVAIQRAMMLAMTVVMNMRMSIFFLSRNINLLVGGI